MASKKQKQAAMTISASTFAHHAVADGRPQAAKRRGDSSATSKRNAAGFDLARASGAVFNTTELLEEIVAYLPPEQTYAIERVYRRFRDVLRSTTALEVVRKRFVQSRERSETWVSRRKVSVSTNFVGLVFTGERGLGTSYSVPATDQQRKMNLSASPPASAQSPRSSKTPRLWLQQRSDSWS